MKTWQQIIIQLKLNIFFQHLFVIITIIHAHPNPQFSPEGVERPVNAKLTRAANKLSSVAFPKDAAEKQENLYPET